MERLLAGLHQIFVDAFKLFLLIFAPDKGFDGTDCGQPLLDHTIEPIDSPL